MALPALRKIGKIDTTPGNIAQIQCIILQASMGPFGLIPAAIVGRNIVLGIIIPEKDQPLCWYHLPEVYPVLYKVSCSVMASHQKRHPCTQAGDNFPVKGIICHDIQASRRVLENPILQCLGNRVKRRPPVGLAINYQ